MTLQKQIKLNPQKENYKISATLPSGKNQKKSILCILREGRITSKAMHNDLAETNKIEPAKGKL